MKMYLAGATLALAAGLVAAGMAHGGSVQKPGPMQGMGGIGQGLSFTAVDPKRPSQTLWRALVKSAGGDFGNGNFSGQDITAWLYDAGKPSPNAKMTAPQGKGSTRTNTVIASGGATYTSLVQRGTYMTAQTVTWNATTKHGVARGNVHYHNSQSGMSATGPVLYFNSGLRYADTKPLPKGQ